MLDFATQARLGAMWAETVVSCAAIAVTATISAAAQAASLWPAPFGRPSAPPAPWPLAAYAAPFGTAFRPAEIWPWANAARWMGATTTWLPVPMPLPVVWGISPWSLLTPVPQAWQPLVSAAALLAAWAPWAQACGSAAALAPYSTYRSDGGHAVAQIAFRPEVLASAYAGLWKQSLAPWTSGRLH